MPRKVKEKTKELNSTEKVKKVQKIYKNSSGNVYSFSPFWNREISFSEKLGEKNILESYSPLYIDNDMVKLVSPYNTKTYIFDKTGKLLRTESLVIPDSKIYFIGFTDTGLPLYYDFGKNYFNAKLIKAGYEGQALKEYTFVQGLQGSRKTGNNGDYWIERYEATCVYNNDGELVKVIFKSEESDSDHHIAFVDKENNFFIDLSNTIRNAISLKNMKLFDEKDC